MFQLFCEMWLVALLEVVLNFGCFVCLCCIEVLSYFTVTVNPKSSIGLRDRNTDFNFYCALILVGEKSFSFFLNPSKRLILCACVLHLSVGFTHLFGSWLDKVLNLNINLLLTMWKRAHVQFLCWGVNGVSIKYQIKCALVLSRKVHHFNALNTFKHRTIG